MKDKNQDTDKNLQQYFDQQQKRPIPPEILEGYTEGIVQRLRVSPRAWKLLALPALGLAMAAAIVFAFWRPWHSPVMTLPAPTLQAIEIDADILDRVSPGDLPPLPTEDLLPQMEMLDSFMVAMESKEDRRLSLEEEASVLMAVGQEDGSSEEPTPQELEYLDDLEAATSTGMA